MRDTYNPTETAKRIKPTWRTWVILVGFGLLLFIPLYYFGEVQLWRPIMFSAIAISSATAVRWDLHNHSWFWVIVGGYIAIHVVGISFIGWNSKWIPAALLAPAVIVDAVLILVTFQIAAKLTPEESSH